MGSNPTPTRGQQLNVPMPDDVEAAALQLNRLLQGPALSQLLQQAPAAAITLEQQRHLVSCYAWLAKVLEGFEQHYTTTAGRGLGLLLRHKAVHSISTLLVWLQQQPQQLQLGLLQRKNDGSRATAGAPTTAHLWVKCAACLTMMSSALVQAATLPQSGCNAAALAAATLQQLEQSGLLSSMHVSLVPLMQAISQQRPSTTQGCQWAHISLAFNLVRVLMCAFDLADHHARALVPAALQHSAVVSLARLLQQLPSCGPVLPAAAAAAVSSPAAGSSSGGSSSNSSSCPSPHQDYINMQLVAAPFIRNLCRLCEQPRTPASVAAEVMQLLLNPAIQMVLLQPLIAHAALLHQQHEAQQQQQQHGGARVGLLPIPAFHQDMLQLLPGQQAYLDAAAFLVAEGYPGVQSNSTRTYWEPADVAVSVLGMAALYSVRSDSHLLGADALILSEAAVRLVLELQLLAAVNMQQQPLDSQDHRLAFDRLNQCNKLLGLQIRNLLRSSGGSCLPLPVLQQAGLQLLQALAAPVQQLLLRGCQDTAALKGLGTTHQLYALRAAAGGVKMVGDGIAAVGSCELPMLAAAHPEAYTALIDCCLRSPLLEAEDMLAAAELLGPAIDAVLGSEAALGNTAAVAGLASAFTTLVKRAVLFTRAATCLLKAGGAGNHSPVTYFLAVVPKVADALLGEATLKAALLAAHTSTSSQARASAALLAVVLARSLVQLADAMDAAGPQLLFDSLLEQPAVNVSWALEATNAMYGTLLGAFDDEQFANVDGQWQQLWQRCVLRAAQSVWNVLVCSGLAAGAAEAGAVEAAPNLLAATAATAVAGDSSAGRPRASSCRAAASSSSSATSCQHVKWGYLLGLQQSQPRWTAATAKYVAGSCELARQLGVEVASVLQGICLAQIPACLEVGQQCAEALELFRVLAAAAPLPVVCNNPSCENLDGVSECAAACKVCAGCKCRYCSAACQAADWRRHKHACRLMAAAGKACM